MGQAATQSQDVTINLTVDPAVAPWAWGQGYPAVRTVSAVSSDRRVLTLDNAAGITQGARIAVFLGTNRVRGGYWLTTVALPPVSNVVTLSDALPVAPPSNAAVCADCGLWDTIRALVLQYFDSLGPGDVPLERTGSQRFPRPTDLGPDRFYSSRLIEKIQDVSGVLGVSITTPEMNTVALRIRFSCQIDQSRSWRRASLRRAPAQCTAMRRRLAR